MKKDKCSYADKYKAIYPPKCGCETCQNKWNKKQAKLGRMEIDLANLMKFANENPIIPKGLEISREKDLALFKDSDGILRLVIPWDDYESILKWKVNESQN